MDAQLQVGTRGRVWTVSKVVDGPDGWEWHVTGPNGSRSGTEATEAQARDAALAAYADLE